MDGVQDSVEIAPLMQSVELSGYRILVKSFPLPALPCSEQPPLSLVEWSSGGGFGGQSGAGSLCSLGGGLYRACTLMLPLPWSYMTLHPALLGECAMNCRAYTMALHYK